MKCNKCTSNFWFLFSKWQITSLVYNGNGNVLRIQWQRKHNQKSWRNNTRSKRKYYIFEKWTAMRLSKAIFLVFASSSLFVFISIKANARFVRRFVTVRSWVHVWLSCHFVPAQNKICHKLRSTPSTVEHSNGSVVTNETPSTYLWFLCTHIAFKSF